MADVHLTVSLALNWILFLALFPATFVWWRRAWRIIVRQDYSEVALKRGEPPPDAERWAPYTAAVNLVAGTLTAYTIYAVVVEAAPFERWTAIAGTTIWLKLILDFAISRHAHWRVKQAQRAERAPTEPNG
jgi:hypothetical protein